MVDAPDAFPKVGLHSSLEVVNGRPAISYYDETFDDLLYVRSNDADGTSWGTPVEVDAPAGGLDVGPASSLAVVGGVPVISYVDASNDNLKYVEALDVDGSSWGTPLVIDASGDISGCTSLAKVGGEPGIAYHDDRNGDLLYVRPLPAAVMWQASEP
jgi:hypothetical protein